MNNRIKQALKTLLIQTQIYRVTRPFAPYIGVVLMFHRVCPRENIVRIANNQILEVTPEYLEQLVDWFREKHFEFISIDQMSACLRQQKEPGPKFVVVTFDDGYLDNYTYAYPLLKRLGVPFTVYVTTQFPDRQVVLWWYLLEDLILERDSLHISIQGKPYSFSCTTSESKVQVFQQIRRQIIAQGENELLSILHEIFDPYTPDLYSRTDELAMNWEQIQTLSADSLVTIGAHTVHHYALSKLPVPAMQMEILTSRQKISDAIQAPVRHFAYPFGTRNEVGQREERAILESGFQTAVTTLTGMIYPYHHKRMAFLPRVNVNQSDHYKLLNMALNGFLPQTFQRF